MSRYQHPSYAGRLCVPPPRLAQPVPAIESIQDARVSALARADRGCCCCATPAVIVYLPVPPGENRPGTTDLLLCMHHYRASRHSLARRGATVLDASGDLVTDRSLW